MGKSLSFVRHQNTMLSAGRFTLRPYRHEDAASMSAAVRESTATVGRWMSWAKPDFNEYDALSWFTVCDVGRAAGESHEFGIFTEENEFVGGCGLNQFSKLNKFCNLGYWVRQTRQRQGAGAAATLALRALALGQLGLARVEIVVAEGNTPSIALARRVGATHECLARNRLQLHGKAVAAHVFSFTSNADA